MWEKNKIKNIFDDFCNNEFIKLFNQELKTEEVDKDFFEKFVKIYTNLINNIKEEHIINQWIKILNNKDGLMNEIRKQIIEFCEECKKPIINYLKKSDFFKKCICLCFQKNEVKFNINLFYYMFESWIVNYFIDLEMWFNDLNDIIDSKYSSIYDNENQILICSECDYDGWIKFSTFNNKLNNLIRSTYTKLDAFNYNLWEFNNNILFQNEFNINIEELNIETKKYISKLDIKEEIKKLNKKINNKEENEQEDIILRSTLEKGWIKEIRNNIVHNFSKNINENDFLCGRRLDNKKIKAVSLLIIDNIILLNWVISELGYFHK